MAAARRVALAKLVLSRVEPGHLKRLDQLARILLFALLLGAVDQVAGTSGCARLIGTRATVRSQRFSAVAWSGNGRVVATGEAEGRIVLRDSGSLHWFGAAKAPEAHIWRLAFAPGTERLAAIYSAASTYGSAPTGILVLEARSGSPRILSLPPDFQPADASPPGRQYREHSWYWRHLDRLAWSPDGSRLAALTQGGSVVVWGPHPTEPSWVVHGATGRFGKRLSFTPDGRELLLPGGTRLEAATGKRLRTSDWPTTLTRGELPNQDLHIGPDGRVLVWQLSDGWRIETWTQPNLPALAVTPDSPSDPEARYDPRAFSPDGTRFAIASDGQGRIDVHELPYGARIATLSTPGSHVPRDLAWHPDGSALAAVTWDGSALVRWQVSIPSRWTHASPTVGMLLGLLGICVWILIRDLSAWLRGSS